MRYLVLTPILTDGGRLPPSNPADPGTWVDRSEDEARPLVALGALAPAPALPDLSLDSSQVAAAPPATHKTAKRVPKAQTKGGAQIPRSGVSSSDKDRQPKVVPAKDGAGGASSKAKGKRS